MKKHDRADQKNFILAIALSVALIIGWQYFIETPKRQEIAKWNAAREKIHKAEEQQKLAQVQKPGELDISKLPREERLKLSPRVAIRSEKLHGSIALKGLRFDDLTLTKYRVELPAESPPVRLLAPAGDAEAYFAQVGWIGQEVKLPDENSVWQADHNELTPEKPVTLRWSNGQGQNFTVVVSLDKDYMFTLTQRVENKSAQNISVVPYGFINRAYNDAGKMHVWIQHEGPIGVLESGLTEIMYKDLRDKSTQTVEHAKGWLGITDKYWLTALVPADTFKGNFSYYKSKGEDRYQAEYSDDALEVTAGGSAENEVRFFAGAKEIEALDAYAKGNTDKGQGPIPLFDRAVDFGALYFLTKPMFLLLNYFFHLAGNFGIAILLLTIVVKLLMYPLANKGYYATTKMRALQPEMKKIQGLHGNDRLKLQQEMMALYKREKVNPAAGCLPILVQIPVFFALYKVLFVAIEMRHAPFFLWLKDLSAPDPTNIFNLFGLIPIEMPSFLHLGILPILMGITMVVQMKQQPAPTDPTQAKIMKIMPYFFTFILATMPAGLVLYWTWSNMLSILQQAVIMRKYKKLHPELA